jgi:hypothetical protein
MNDALCEAEKKVHDEFLKEVKEGVYEIDRMSKESSIVSIIYIRILIC